MLPYLQNYVFCLVEDSYSFFCRKEQMINDTILILLLLGGGEWR